jgi:hypothetical protein
VQESFHLVNDRQTEIHTAESLMPEPSAFEDEMAIDLKQDVGLFILRSLSLLIPFGIKRNCLSSGRS